MRRKIILMLIGVFVAGITIGYVSSELQKEEYGGAFSTGFMMERPITKKDCEKFMK